MAKQTVIKQTEEVKYKVLKIVLCILAVIAGGISAIYSLIHAFTAEMPLPWYVSVSCILCGAFTAYFFGKRANMLFEIVK